MSVDPFSPVAPVRLRALLLPIGRIKRSRFLGFAKRVQSQNVVRLGDVSPDGRASRNTFSPLAFPSGMVIYDLSTSAPATPYVETFPFETSREPLVILAIADGAELSSEAAALQRKPNGTAGANHSHAQRLEEIKQDLELLQDDYPRSFVRQLLVFNYEGIDILQTDEEGITWIPPAERSRPTTIKTVMCDITASALKEMAGLAQAMEAWPTIDSPGISYSEPNQTSDVRPTGKLQHRMTMPAQLPSRPNGSSTEATDSSSTRGGQDSPTTFDQIARSIQRASRADTLKSSSNTSSKEHSRERKSVSGGGSAVSNDRAKDKARGRLKVVVGCLYLQAGLWPDAMKELVEGVTVARSCGDCVWHAKALEAVLLCMLMLGWAGMDFQIPQVCYPTSDKSAQKPPPSTTDSYTSGHQDPERCVASLQSLAELLPDISAQILNLYTRATNLTDEPVPQLLFSETVVRLSRLLSIIYARDGSLDDEGLKHIVTNSPLRLNRNADHPRGHMLLSRTEISSFLFRASPLTPQSDMPGTDIVSVLAGMASVLSLLGLERKKSFILKEIVSILIPGLVQARKVGAAEMGIHPAAGLLALNNTNFDVNALDVGPANLSESMRTLLSLVGETYGVQKTTDQSVRISSTDSNQSNDSVEAITERTLRYANLRAYGDMFLKVDLLKSCISLSEALPDFHGVLLFTVDLLRTIKGTIMLSAGKYHPPPALAQEEQVRLYNNVKRTVGAAGMLGTPDLEAEYWDDFLVRGIELVNLPDSQVPIRRSKQSAVDSDGEKTPFIYNPLAKTAISRPEFLLVAGEYAEFKVTLQNPFEFDVEIETLRLEGQGVPFQSSVEGLWLAPLSLQERTIPVLATGEGTLTITGCTAKIRYCRSRRFPLFKKFWKPDVGSKFKKLGLAAKEEQRERPESWGSSVSANTRLAPKAPEAEIVTLNVIKEQPILVVDSTSLSQSAIMVLEGETTSFDITLANMSSSPVDLVHFTFQDSTTRQFQSALQNKENLPGDVYELEWQLVTKPVLRRRGGNDGSASIAPGAKATFTVDVFGKPGLFDAEVLIEYGCIGGSPSNLPDKFYVRQISMPLTITVNASIDIVRCDVFPISGDIAWSNQRLTKPRDGNHFSSESSSSEPESSSTSRSLTKRRESQFPSLLSRLGTGTVDSGHCLLLLDVRNNWPNPLYISVSLDNQWRSSLTGDSPRETDLPGSVHEVVDEIQPGHISRVALVIPRIFIQNPHRPVPFLNSGFKRQFVVSSHKLSYEAEMLSREVFWYREELLKHLRGSWEDNIAGREGSIELRNIRLYDRMLDALRFDEVDVKFSLEPMGREGDNTGDGQRIASVVQTGQSKYTARTDSFLQLRVMISNHSLKRIHPILRLQPCLRNQPHTVALELSKRLAWTGMLQRALPLLGPGETSEAILGLTILCRGEYEICASVEEIRPTDAHTPASAKRTSDGPTSADTELPDTLHDAFRNVAPNQRRVWYSRVPCTILAHD